MEQWLETSIKWLLGPEIGNEKRPGHLWPLWIFLRALAAIYFSAFYSLLFQIKGLIGPHGILPAQQYFLAVGRAMPGLKYCVAPSLFWIASSSHMMMAVMWVGLIAAAFAFLNLWPRLCFLI